MTARVTPIIKVPTDTITLPIVALRLHKPDEAFRSAVSPAEAVAVYFLSAAAWMEFRPAVTGRSYDPPESTTRSEIQDAILEV
ncbi:uncharacterized protein L199_003305 [Kwoniella botswanensis]|uniref:uncharacterized protein n=1 Tax=Kwoniella botswanensis TaxID=1268659 RepID=UPI00315DE919